MISRDLKAILKQLLCENMNEKHLLKMQQTMKYLFWNIYNPEPG